MTVTGRNENTQATFPVDVASNVPYVVVRQLTLERGGRGPGIDFVIELGYDLGTDEPPACIALRAVVGATISDPETHTDLRPRVYDDWAPVSWATRPATIRIAAPLSANYWGAPTSAEVDLHVSAWHTPPPA
ncbi:hypothetical protein [Curtobacterium sp. MCPF17_052]|uniref:hypothetical protein n=1 Tax=Curtobacterium sp. MCPF17_052 TaxID=2175655 RepID=UPI0011B4A2EE|nr:hypothetical protein [Curtobacterium sp. MCPF17_052]WIB13319.1 hypothetical protein DEJ36_05595 [Curtobacterium sp. MCPF17_052]